MAAKLPARDRRVIGMLIFLSLALVTRLTIFLRQRATDDFGAVDASAAVQMLLVGAMSFALLTAPGIGTLYRRLRGSSINGYFGYLLFCAVGILWSRIPAFSAYRVTEHFVMNAAVLAIVYYCRSFFRAEKVVLILAATVLALGVGANLRLCGFSLAGLRSNNYGASACMLCAYCFAELWTAQGRRSRWLKLGFAGAFASVLLSLSLASWLSVLLGFVVAGMIRKRGKGWFFLIILIAGGTFLLSPETTHKVILQNSDDKKLTEMSGRKMLWESYKEVFAERPWAGQGFAVSARIGRIATTNTHNSAWAVLLGGGIIGAAFVVTAGLRFSREVLVALKRTRGPGLSGCTAAFCAGVLNSLSLSLLGETWIPPTYVFFLFFALHTLYIRQGSQNTARAPQLGAGHPNPAPRAIQI